MIPTIARVGQWFHRHILEHYVFYQSAYGLMLVMLFKVTETTLIRHIGEVPLSRVSILGASLIGLAAALRHGKRNWRAFHLSVFILGLVVIVISATMLASVAVSHPVVALPLFLSAGIAAWWTGVYCLDLSIMDKERNRRIGKRAVKYFVLCAALLYPSSALIDQYYKRRIGSTMATTSGGIPGSAPYEELMSRVEAIMLQATAVQFFLAVVVVIAFFLLVKSTKGPGGGAAQS